MDSQQVFLVPQVPTLPSSNPTLHHHQPQKCTTQMVQQPLQQHHHQQPQCSICGTTQKLLRCAKCKAIYYCSTNHQHLDWPTHKLECRQLAKQRQTNNRLTQLTNGCGAMNISSHANTLTESSTTLATNNWSNTLSHPHTNPHSPPLHQQQQPNSHNIDAALILGTHETEILNSKAESVTRNSNRSEYLDNFDANSTTTDQMHIMGSNGLNLFDMIESSNQDNTHYYQTSAPQQQQQVDEEEPTNPAAATSYTEPLNDHQEQLPSEHLQQQQNVVDQSQEQQQQQSHQQQQQIQQVLQYPVPQLSNHLINQHEKSSSYQIGTAAFDESVFENADELRYEELCRNIINDMNQYGLSVVDDFLGRDNGLQILNEVHKMYSAGVFKDGQLVNNVKSEQDLRTIRGDKITWVKGVEPGCSNVGYLINQIDAVICRANSMLDNGKLGDYVIKERTKAMVACYPGSGSHYVMHVDNPNKDGRVITAIYYLNLNWDSRDSGGMLRIFPEQTKSVADIEPKFDRLIFFWSDKRNPHEVQPAHRTRYAITVWYFDANEREQALNRCKNKQNSNNANKGQNSLNTKTNSSTANKTSSIDSITSPSTTTTSLTSSASSLSSSSPAVPTLNASLTPDDSLEESTTNLTNTETNSSRPIQVVRPTYIHK